MERKEAINQLYKIYQAKNSLLAVREDKDKRRLKKDVEALEYAIRALEKEK